jgi:hypothetical protein
MVMTGFNDTHNFQNRLDEIPGYVDLGKLMTDPPQEVQWIVEGIISPQGLTALVGEAKIGKSIFALELAIAVSTGAKIADLGTTKTRTLYLDLENNPETVLRDRLLAFDCHPESLDNLKLLSFPELPAFDSASGGKALVEIVDQLDVGLVIIDTVSRVVSGEENSNDTWNRLYRHTELPLKQRGVAMMRVDHTGKDATKGARGGSAKSGDVDRVIRMTSNRNGQIMLRTEAARTRGGFESITLERRDTPNLHHARINGKVQSPDNSRADYLIDLLNRNGYPAGLSNRETRDALGKLGQRCSKENSAEVTRLRKAPPTESPESIEEENCPAKGTGQVWSWAVPTFDGTSPKPRNANLRCLQ